MKRLKNTKGITLVALIITIIVLLILAMVSIRLVINGGIIGKANKTVSDYKIAEEKEQIQLGYNDYQLAMSMGQSEPLSVEGANVEGNGPWTITFANGEAHQYTLSADGKVIDGPITGGTDVGNNSFTIMASVTNGTYSGTTSIGSGETVTITITPNNAYDLPSDVTVVGATKSYNSETGVLTISNATGDVSISAICGIHLETFTTCGYDFVFAPGMTWGDFIELQDSKNDWGYNDGMQTVVWHNWVLDDVNYSDEIVANRTYTGYLYCCFDAGSKILMSDGTEKNIEEIVSGDKVLSYNESTHEFIPETVGKLIVNNFSSDLVYVHLSDGRTLGMTAYHPLLTTEGWKSLQPEIAKKQLGITEEVGLLEIGDNLIEYGSIGQIVDIEHRDEKEGYTTYTLSMDGDLHNFIVNNVVAHNAADKCGYASGEMPNASVYQRDCVTGHWPKQ